MKVADKLNLIINQYEKNKLSHAFLIETDNIDRCLVDVKEIIKLINKKDDNKDIDLLIEHNNLPSLIIIEPDGMSIKKSQLEELEQKFSTKPIYSIYNTYIILHADKMNDSSANTLLKFLEEPESNIIGFLVVSNKENVLPTIKSRCEIIHVDYNEQKIVDKELSDLVDLYINNIYNTSDYLINKKIILSNYSERTDIEKILIIMFDKYYEEYKNNFSDKQLRIKYLKIKDIVENKLDMLRNNCNIELVLDSLVIEMRRSND